MIDKDMLFGYVLLHGHGWEYKYPEMVMVSPNGAIVKQNELFRMADEQHARATLERGGTPFGTWKKD